MSASTATESQAWTLDWVAALAVITAQLVAMLHPEAIPLDSEELYNAAHGRMLQLGHLTDLQALQYRSYCGGCSLNALLSAGLFTVFGPSLLAYKMVSVLYVGLAVLAGSRWLRLQIGPPAAVAFAGLFILAPPTWMELSVVAWGNHMEAGCLAIVAMVLTARLHRTSDRSTALILGLVLAFAGWIGFPSGFIALAVLGTLMLGQRWSILPWIAVGAAPLFCLWGLQVTVANTSPFETIYYEGERLPQLSRVPEKIASLLAPRQLVALFGHPQDRLGWIMGWMWSGALVWGVVIALRAGRHGARVAVGFLCSFIAVYSLVRFTVWAPPAPHIAPPGSMRYAAPVFPLAFFVIAAGVGRAWINGRRTTVLLVVCLVAGSGIRARTAKLTGPFPSWAALETIGPDLIYFRDQASYTLSAAHHSQCDETDDGVESLHAFGAGWNDARDLLSGTKTMPRLAPPPNRPSRAYYEGVGEWVRSQVDPRSQRGPEMLDEVSRLLAAQPEPGLRAALQEAAWRRSTDWMRLALDNEPHTSGTLRRIEGMAEQVSPPAMLAVTHALGRRWAFDVTQWANPRTTPMPEAPWPMGFALGLGEGVGERWGPGTDPTNWLMIPDDDLSDFHNGLTEGHRRRWLSR